MDKELTFLYIIHFLYSFVSNKLLSNRRTLASYVERGPDFDFHQRPCTAESFQTMQFIIYRYNYPLFPVLY